MTKVLVVEDEVQILDIIDQYLQSQNFDVTTCTNGLDGYVKVQQDNFDLIITDIMMDTMNGDEMINLIKKTNNKSKIIVTSAISNETDITLIKNLGIDAYLEKPFSVLSLKDTIDRVM